MKNVLKVIVALAVLAGIAGTAQATEINKNIKSVYASDMKGSLQCMEMVRAGSKASCCSAVNGKNTRKMSKKEAKRLIRKWDNT